MSDHTQRRGVRPAGAVLGEGKPPPPFLRAAQGFALVASIGAGFSSFFGLRDFFVEQGGVIGWLLPLSLALVVTALVAFCWHLIMELAAHA